MAGGGSAEADHGSCAGDEASLRQARWGRSGCNAQLKRHGSIGLDVRAVDAAGIQVRCCHASSFKKGKFDSCHHNSVKLGVTLKIMPLNGMIFNMRSNFKKLEWHGSN
jgi:hypothetical protein